MAPSLSFHEWENPRPDQGEVLREEKQKDFLDYHQHKRRKVAQLGTTLEGKADTCLEMHPSPAPCEPLKDLEVVAGSFETDWKDSKC